MIMLKYLFVFPFSIKFGLKTYYRMFIKDLCNVHLDFIFSEQLFKYISYWRKSIQCVNYKYVTSGFCLVPVNAEYLKLHQLWARYSEVLCCTIVYSETGVGHYIVSSPLFSVQPQMLVSPLSPVSDCWSTQYLINNSKNTSFSDIWWQNMTSTGDYNNYIDIWELKGFGWSIL